MTRFLGNGIQHKATGPYFFQCPLSIDGPLIRAGGDDLFGGDRIFTIGYGGGDGSEFPSGIICKETDISQATFPHGKGDRLANIKT